MPKGGPELHGIVEPGAALARTVSSEPVTSGLYLQRELYAFLESLRAGGGNLRSPSGQNDIGSTNLLGSVDQPIMFVMAKKRLGASRPTHLTTSMTPAIEIEPATPYSSGTETGGPSSTTIIVHSPKDHGEFEPHLEIEVDSNLGHRIDTGLVASFFEGAARLATSVPGVEYGALHVKNPPREITEWLGEQPGWARYYEGRNEWDLKPYEPDRTGQRRRSENVHFIKWLDAPAA